MPFQIPDNYIIPRKRKSDFPQAILMGETNAYPRGPLDIYKSQRRPLDPGNNGKLLLRLAKPLRKVLAANHASYYVAYFQAKFTEHKASNPVAPASLFFHALDSTIDELEVHRDYGNRSIKRRQIGQLLKHVDKVYKESLPHQDGVDIPHIEWRKNMIVAYPAFRRRIKKMKPWGLEQYVAMAVLLVTACVILFAPFFAPPSTMLSAA